MWEHPDQIASLVTATVMVLSAVGGGLYRLWRSISGRFDLLQRERDQAFTSLRDYMDGVFDRHEARDQSRHEDNLKEFRKVYVALATLGWRNGSTGSP